MFSKSENQQVLRNILESVERTQNKLKYEVDRTDRYFDALLNKTLAILSIAGLMTTLLLLNRNSEPFLRNYLLWVFGYFIFGFAFFLKATARKTLVVDGFREPTDGDLNHAILTGQDYCLDYNKVLGELVNEYKQSRKYASLSELAAVLFVIAFSIQYYISVLSFSVTWEFYLLLNILLLTIGRMAYKSWYVDLIHPVSMYQDYLKKVGDVNAGAKIP